MSPFVPPSDRITVFFGSEGENEEAFLGHLKSVYSRGKASVTIRHAGGKSPDWIVEKSTTQRAGKRYDYSAILMDTDKPWGNAKQAALSAGFDAVFGSSPCLEGLLLSILNDLPIPTDSHECKDTFQAKYNRGKNVLTEEACSKCLTKEYLDQARRRVPLLDIIIRRLEGD
jgi:hypothetical protein